MNKMPGVGGLQELGTDWIVNNIQMGLVLVDASGVVRLFNRWMAERTGLAHESVVGQKLADVFPELQGGRVLQAIASALASGFPSLLSNTLHPTPLPLFADEHKRAAGERVQQSIRIQPSAPCANGMRQVMLEIGDVTAAVRRERMLTQQANQLKALSSTDALTGLANRRKLDEVLDSEYRRALRGRHPLAVVLVDIDLFKVFNDTYGHQGGDQCLMQVSLVMQSVLKRPSDIAARYGGEEFMMVLPETDLQGAVAVAKALRVTLVEQGLTHAGNPNGGIVTVSQGVAVVVPDANTSLANLVSQADVALYAAKRAGRNRVAVLSADIDIDPEVVIAPGTSL